MKILVLNGGSSSLKGLLCDLGKPLPRQPPPALWELNVQWGLRPGFAEMQVRRGNGKTESQEIPIHSPADAIGPALETLWSGPSRSITAPGEIDVVGHRVVHGGSRLTASSRITAEVKEEIAKVAEFAPEHNPLELQVIATAERLVGKAAVQVAVFDTAFHSTLPREAAVYPGPYRWFEQGIRRYGFHGISHRYASRRAAEIVGKNVSSLRMVSCHLGNGCSLAAIKDGVSVDTTMGFTPLEGLMMGTRSGSIDPGILIYLARQHGRTADELDHMLNEESGLKGISGVSGDMREILAAISSGNPRAKLAFDIYAHRLCGGLGAMIATLGGLDVLAFTAGVGEHCAPLRERVCQRFGFLGIRLDSEKNAASPPDGEISTAESAVRVLIIHAEEDWEIMRECYRLASER